MPGSGPVLGRSGVGCDVALLAGTGACGAFTAFSSISFGTVRLWETDGRGRTVANAAGNLLGAGLALVMSWAIVGLL